MRTLLSAFFWLTCCFDGLPADRPLPSKPNILLITADDMSCDSVGVYGCKLKETTPNMDRLASEGMRFHYAHVPSASCMPSRNAMLSGRYSHKNKVEGFYQVRDIQYPVMADLMSAAGYFTAIRGKVPHSTPYHPYKWDLVINDEAGRVNRKNVASYGQSTRQGIQAARQAVKPFYLNINISDPHKPFYGEGPRGVALEDPNVPSRVFEAEETPVPGFLPDDPVVRKELAQYYSSVRRADDCLGEVLKALQESGLETNTVVIFLSDHGMPLPGAKTQVYHHSTRTPWMVRWPGVVKAGMVDQRHMISGVDLLPTCLDIAGIAHPPGLDGRSIVPLIQGQTQPGREMIFKEHNENSGGNRNPMRAIETKQYLYIFNPWVNGKRVMATATAGTHTWRRMKELAGSNSAMAARVELLDHRVLEELYHVERDPDCLKNLIDDPGSQAELKRLRSALEEWMARTDDPLLDVFKRRHDPVAREEYMTAVIQQAQERGDRRGRRRQTDE